VDFDDALRQRKQREQTFTLRGATFRLNPSPRPEIITAFEDALDGMRLPPGTPGYVNGIHMLEVYDALVKEHIRPMDHAEYDRLRKVEGEDAITISDLEILAKGLLAMAAGRPFEQPDASSGGSQNGTPGTHSTDVSSSPLDAASEA